jgi:hypothetical protein
MLSPSSSSSFGELLKRINPFGIAVLGGIISASFSSIPPSFLFFAILFNYFSALPLYFVAFGWGWKHCFTACITAFLCFVFLSTEKVILVQLISIYIPALIVSASVLHRTKVADRSDSQLVNSTTYQWYPAGYSISWVSLYGIFLVAILTFFVLPDSASPEQILKEWLGKFIDLSTIKDVSPLFFRVIPSISIISTIFTSLVNAVVTQRLLASLRLNRRPYPTPNDFLIHTHWDIVFALGLILQLTDHRLFAFMGSNIILISCVPLFLLGLTVAKAWLSQFEETQIWLYLLVVLCFLLVWPGLFVVGLGILEPLLNLRQRFLTHDKVEK